MAKYAKKLTKEELLRGGITEITDSGLVYNNNILRELAINKQGYYCFTIYELDSDGNKIKLPAKRTFKDREKTYNTYVYKTRSIPLHRAIWAWYNGEVPEGMVVDHINNKHSNLEEDYKLSNLQLLTPKENVIKERELSTRQIKCKLDRPRSYYEDKLKKYEALYEVAKEAGGADKVHKLRGNIAQCRARLRFWDAHRKEIEANMYIKKQLTEEQIKAKEDRKDLKELIYWKKVFKSQGNKAMWRECVKVEKLWPELAPVVKANVMKTLRDFVRR